MNEQLRLVRPHMNFVTIGMFSLNIQGIGRSILEVQEEREEPLPNGEGPRYQVLTSHLISNKNSTTVVSLQSEKKIIKSVFLHFSSHKRKYTKGFFIFMETAIAPI